MKGLDSEAKGFADWALVEVDRTIDGREPLAIRRDGKIGNDAGVYVIGHPRGLPLKVADKAELMSNDAESYFVATLDTYRANSGSPVFNASTHQVEGILVRGGQDYRYVRNTDTQCYESVIIADGSNRGEHVNRTTLFQEKVP